MATFSDAAATPRTAEPACPHCDGAGYYKEAVPFGHPHFGVLFPCVCKLHEKEQRAAEELRELSNLDPFEDKTFETFNQDVPGVRLAYSRAVEYSKRPQGWLILFGNYKGTERRSGFHWTNPLYARHRGAAPASAPAPKTVKLGPLAVADSRSGPKLKTKLSLRAHNFNSEKLKVNDKRGNPVEIAAVVVWRVQDTAQAVFDVEDYESYVQVQSESAIRNIASLYAYDHGEEHELTLRGGGDEVAHALKKELEVRLAKAGVVVEEARLTHLA